MTNLLVPAAAKKIRVGRIILIILLLAVLGVCGFFGYRWWKSNQVPIYENISTVGTTLANKSIELTIEKADVIPSISGFALDPEYVYVGVVYTYKNITAEPIEWKDFPFIYIAQYEDTGAGYKIIKETEQEFDMNALRYYGLAEEIVFSGSRENLPAGESRRSADVIKLKAADYNSENLYFVSVDNVEAITAITPLPAE